MANAAASKCSCQNNYMKIARNIGLILLGMVIWVSGFIFISIPAIDE